MGFRCHDCSHKGKQFPGGCCPACGSNNIKRLEPRGAAREQMQARGPFKQALNFVLWGTLVWLIYDSYHLIYPQTAGTQGDDTQSQYQVTDSGTLSNQ